MDIGLADVMILHLRYILLLWVVVKYQFDIAAAAVVVVVVVDNVVAAVVVAGIVVVVAGVVVDILESLHHQHKLGFHFLELH